MTALPCDGNFNEFWHHVQDLFGRHLCFMKFWVPKALASSIVAPIGLRQHQSQRDTLEALDKGFAGYGVGNDVLLEHPCDLLFGAAQSLVKS